MAHEVTIEAIRDANPSWEKRIQSELCDFQLDHDADVLYVAFGTPTESFSFPLQGEPGVYLRVQVDDLQVVGFDILNFRQSFLKNHPDARQVFEPALSFFGNTDWRIQIKPPADGGQVRLLIPAPVIATVSYFRDYLPKAAPELVAA